MDFFIPDGKIAVFCDGVYYHADPRKYNATHKVYSKTAKQIWEKDLRQKSFLESQGYKVLRFWENEIIENVDRCIKVIKDNL